MNVSYIEDTATSNGPKLFHTSQGRLVILNFDPQNMFYAFLSVG